MTAHDIRPKSKGANRQETVRVIVRCRPLSTTEISQGHRSIINLHPERGLIELKNPSQPDELSKDFTFDAIYGESSKQKDLYDETFRDLVDSVLNGFNGTIFAYGQTGTGKTYTMEGKASVAEERGVIYNCFDHIFQHISQSRNQKYLVRASYLEIYQEEIRDLLDKDGKKLELKERPDIGVYVKDLSSSVTKSVEELKSVMLVGNANRSVGRTNMNEHSSRSHAIFMITIECCEIGIDGENHIRVGKLNLVDLAGSERQAKTGASGERFKEATKINLSLSALGNVISSLVDGKSSHIPYRDSKLTRLLQDSLGGNSKTVMVACIGPASYNFEETLGTLRYANRAKNIKNKPRINEDPKDALLREFQDEINRLRAMLSAKKENKGMDGSRGEEYYKEQHRNLEADKQKILSDDSIVKEERKRILEALEKRSKELDTEKESQARMAEKIKAMESKLLGGTNLLDHTREQESQLERKRKELADQKRKEREILEILEQQDEGTAEIHQTFTNLQQEVDAKTKKLNKFKLKLRKLRNEIHDTTVAHSQERQELERDVSEINKELKLKLLIVDNFVPNDVRQRVKELAVWSEEDSVWNLPGARPLSGSSRPSTSDAKGNILVVDGQGVFTRSIGTDSGVGSNTSSSSVLRDNYLDRRPVSIPGLRRPMSSYERLMVDQAREQMSGQRRPFINSNYSVEPKMNEDIIRFCGENVLVFSTLERLHPNVVDFSEDSSQTVGSTSTLEKNVVIDASKSSNSHFSRLRSPSIDSRSISLKKRRRPQRASQNSCLHVSKGKRPRVKCSNTSFSGPYLIHIPFPLQFNSQTTPPVIDPVESFRKAVQIKQYPKFTSASSSSSESSEGICADYSSKGARSMTSSLMNEDLWIDNLTTRFGHVYNMDQSFDFNVLKTRSSSVPRSPSIHMAMSSIERTPKSTRIPSLMTQSCSAGVHNGGRLRKDLTSASAPACGSTEQLCESYVSVAREAKVLLERSRKRTPLRSRVYDSRCMMDTRPRTSMSCSMFSLRPKVEPPRLLARPRWNRFGEDSVEKTSMELSMYRSHMNTSMAACRSTSVPIENIDKKESVRLFRVRNTYDGLLPLTMKRLVAWYRITSAKCRNCRCEQRLHRLSCHSTRSKTSNIGVSKKGVVSRSRCICSLGPSSFSLTKSNSPLQYIYDIAAIFAAIAFLLNLILSFFF